MSASNDRPRDAWADAVLSNDLADLAVPGVVVELDAAAAERHGAFQETALSDADAWEANSGD